MRILCICNHGNVRSSCMVRELKDLGHESIAIGISHNPLNSESNLFSEETVDYFIEWADLVFDFSDINSITMNDDPGICDRLKNKSKEIKRYYVGGDRWGNPFHPELRSIMQSIIKKENISRCENE